MNSNNNSVIYAASNNVMFYSQNKEHKSTLNDFTGVEAYTNAYVGANYKPYNKKDCKNNKRNTITSIIKHKRET